MSKQRNEMIVTPEGVAVWPKLTKPDTKFNPDGEYRTKLRMPYEVAENLIKKIEAVNKANVEAKTKELKKKIKEGNLPFAEVIGDDGNPTGEVEFSFKKKAKLTLKDGSVIDTNIKVFDSKNKPLPDGVDVWGGSIIKVAAELVPYYTPAVGAGVSLRLSAVQVKKLVQGGGGSTNGASYGFDVEEGGYEAPAAENIFDSQEQSHSAEENEDF